ncbi:MAG: hypothetical protein UR91_C0004G0016 [Candidatus Nomurabacteria bacterium GW2011_GWC2_35_8]|nr:MAG: hypothetical protein UR91_C0004G0016 [Candidatus Nomurabacteria bacterium GW2011_GWC2_35_8]
MILTLIGIILTLVPFLLVFYFKDKFRIFLYIIAFDFAFHILIAFFTQVFHIFTYPVIITIHTLVAIGVVSFMIKFKEKFSKIKINWFLILAVVIIFFELWSVHNFYTGPVNTINGSDTVSQSTYVYPYFSDEWIGASLENYSIKNNSLPTVNPLDANKYFKNPMLVFFSVISEFFLLFNLNPIFHVSFFALFSGIFVCLSIYLILKSFGIGNFISIFTILSIPFITNGANLPGIWYLMPFLVSFIFFIISLIGINSDDKKLSWITTFLSLVIYPPMVVFIVPVFIADYFTKNISDHEVRVRNFSMNLSVILCAGVFVSIVVFWGSEASLFIKNIFTYLFRTNLDGGIPSFPIWNIIPIIFFPFILLGIWEILKKKLYFILGPIIVGFIFWLFYTSTMKVFLIDYPRVVVITSILLVFCGGLGIDFLIKWLKQRYVFLNNKNFENVFVFVLFIIFIVLSFFYPVSQNWEKLKLNVNMNGVIKKFSPASPINRYLVEDDLRLFNSISEKRFIAPAWKGLVIGVATGNYPLESKSSTITNKILLYSNFIKANCEDKTKLSKKYKIDYVYSTKFSCSGFDWLGVSEEKLNLYKVF